METPNQRMKLAEMVTDLYEACGVELEPTFPKVLIRVLPRHQKRNGIWLPDGSTKDQNKPVLEGYVLKTYKPFYQKIYLTEARWVKDDPDPEVRYTQRVECQFRPGDHVLFPHIEFGIMPTNLDEGKGDYRLVPENLIQGKLTYAIKPLVDELAEYFQETEVQDYPLSATKENVELFLKKYDVIRKDGESRTISGK